MRRAEELQLRMSSIEALGILKGRLHYNYLSSALGLPPSVLSRYVNGRVIPGAETARRIMSIFRGELMGEVESRIRRDDVGGIDVSGVVLDPALLRQVASSEFGWLSGMKVDKVMTMEADGIPVAYQFASALGVRVAVVRKSKKVGVKDFVEAKQVFESGAYRYIYLPKGSVRRGEYVLLVDDVVRTGTTMRALSMLCGEVKANVAAAFSVVGFRRSIEALRGELGIPIESFLTMER